MPLLTLWGCTSGFEVVISRVRLEVGKEDVGEEGAGLEHSKWIRMRWEGRTDQRRQGLSVSQTI